MKGWLNILLLMPGLLGAQNRLRAYEYWFDDQVQNRQVQSIGASSAYSLQTGIGTGGLVYGQHTLHIRFLDDSGKYSLPVSQVFYKKEGGASVSSLIPQMQYWFNGMTDQAQLLSYTPATQLNLQTLLSATSAPPGLNQLHLRFRDNTGQWSNLISQAFFAVPVPGTDAGKKINAYRYWFDESILQMQTLTLTPAIQTQLNIGLPAGNLSPGMHSLQVQFRDNSGLWSETFRYPFYSTDPVTGTANLITGYRYWFNDTDASQMVRHLIPAELNPLIQTSVDLGCLTAGDHQLHIQFSDRKGQWSIPLNDTVQLPVITDYVYRFTGNGNWSNPANWQNNAVPAPDLPGCREIIIDHAPGGSCILDIPQYLLKHARLTVLSGKKLVVPQQLEIR